MRQKEIDSAWDGELWFQAPQIAKGIGCTVADALLAIDELQDTWRIATRQTVCGFAEYRTRGGLGEPSYFEEGRHQIDSAL
jgi:hypothetical protein